jgi:glycosyltransferase involved in cell wall biosynthesis
VTIFAGRARPGSSAGLVVRSLDESGGHYDVAVYVTGALGHFRDPCAARARGRVNVFWINGPSQVEPPQFVDLDWIIAPAGFLARRAIDEWGLAGERVVVIAGEAVRERWNEHADGRRDPYRGVYASHPSKGLREAVEVLARCQSTTRRCALDVYGTGQFWGTSLESHAAAAPWVNLVGDASESDLAARMSGYGFMPYFTEWLDGFSTATAEAMAAGVIVFATAHGSNAEFIRHGWNGFLVRAVDGRPDLDQAERLLASYLHEPHAFEAVRANAGRSVPTWDDQARQWVSVWER